MAERDVADAELTVADLLVRGLSLPPLPEPPGTVPPGTVCAIGGVPIDVGYRVQEVVTSATAEFLDTYRGLVHGYVSVAAARCIRSANPRAGNPCARSHLAFADGSYAAPLINRASALAQGRPCWSDLVRQVWPARRGERCLVLLTTDTKKRLWPRARVTTLGARTAVYLHDSGSNASGTIVVAWHDLLRCLDDVETVYAAGVTKRAIATTVYARAPSGIAYRSLRAYEALVRPWRAHPAFPVALLIAQRSLEEPA